MGCSLRVERSISPSVYYMVYCIGMVCVSSLLCTRLITVLVGIGYRGRIGRGGGEQKKRKAFYRPCNKGRGKCLFRTSFVLVPYLIKEQ